MKRVEVSIIGTGALGRTLARALWDEGFPIAGLYNRTPSAMDRFAESIQPRRKGVFPIETDGLGQIIFITVPDGAIEEVAGQLAATSFDFSGRHVVHCSGSKAAQALSALKKLGANTAVFHPLQTFTASSTPEDLKGIYFDVEGDENALHLLKELTGVFGSACSTISPQAKPYLHAAGVVASNYLVALIRLSEMIVKMGGMDEHEIRKALMPLVTKSLENISDSDRLVDALSGPIARGDSGTVSQHLQLLEDQPKVQNLYQQLGDITLDVAKEGDRLSEEQVKRLQLLLKS